MTDELIRKSDALAVIDELKAEFEAGGTAAMALDLAREPIAALPAVARVYDLDPATYAPVDAHPPADPVVNAPDPAAIREAALEKVKQARLLVDVGALNLTGDTAEYASATVNEILRMLDQSLALIAKGAAE